MVKILLALIILLATPTFTASAPSLSEAAKAKICARVKALVAKHGVEGAITLARRRGFSESQISAASVCL